MLEFGGKEQTTQSLRDVHVVSMLERARANLRAGFRLMRKAPGFSLAVILTLALGIGANSAVFSAIDAVLLRPLPFPRSGELLLVRQYEHAGTDANQFVASVRLRDWIGINSTFQGMTGYYTEDVSELSTELPEKVTMASVTSGFLQVMGVGPALGRDFMSDEEKFAGPQAVIISDRFWKSRFAANPNALGTLEEAINKVRAMPAKPSFMIHTGDITHLSKAQEFDDADRIISQAKLDVHYVPGEHDIIDEEVKLYKERYGRGTKGGGWYSFDAGGVHFVGLVNVANLKGGGLGSLGDDQLEWLEDDLKGKSKSTPVVLFAHIPLWTVYPQWGWGTEDGARALEYVKGFGSVTVLNGHIHQVMQKVEGNVTFHTARSTAFPQPAPGTAPSPGPMKVEDAKLRSLLGVASINFKQGNERLAIIDTPLQG
jgi:hypothetical protein